MIWDSIRISWCTTAVPTIFSLAASATATVAEPHPLAASPPHPPLPHPLHSQHRQQGPNLCCRIHPFFHNDRPPTHSHEDPLGPILAIDNTTDQGKEDGWPPCLPRDSPSHLPHSASVAATHPWNNRPVAPTTARAIPFSSSNWFQFACATGLGDALSAAVVTFGSALNSKSTSGPWEGRFGGERSVSGLPLVTLATEPGPCVSGASF